MAQVWRFPLTPFVSAAGTAVTAAALTGSGCADLPQVPPGLLVVGAKLIIEAELEVTSTSATPTMILGAYMGSVGQAIGSKAVLGASAALAISASATAWSVHLRYVGTFRTLSATAGVINGSGTIESWANTGLSGDGTTNPFPITAALRTVSTLNTSQVNEIDVGITLSSTAGTPSITVTNLWGELSG